MIRHAPTTRPMASSEASNAGAPSSSGRGCQVQGTRFRTQTFLRLRQLVGSSGDAEAAMNQPPIKRPRFDLKKSKPVGRIVEEVRVSKTFKKKSADPNAPAHPSR